MENFDFSNKTNITLYANKPVIRTESKVVVVLLASNWENYTQSVNVDDVTASNLIFVSPTPESFIPYSAATVRCISQSYKTLEFKCSDIPTADLLVNVVIRK